MPFLGQDWRSPGEQWVKSSDGWEKLRLWRLKLLEHLNENMIARLMKLPHAELTNYNMSPEQHISNCHQPHIFMNKVSKEQKVQITISDALSGLDMAAAVKDPQRFNYVCKLLELLIEHKLCSLSGSAQRQLLNLVEEALNTVLKTQMNIHVLRELLQALKTGLAEGEYYHVGCSTLWDKHIHTVERLQNTLNTFKLTERENDGKMTLEELPQECLWDILHRFTDSQDIINTGLVDNHLLADMAEDRLLWQHLCLFHFDDKQLAAVMKPGEHIDKLTTDDWKKLHHRLTKRFGKKAVYAEMLSLCRNCKAIFWQRRGHPCQVTNVPPKTVPVTPVMCLELFTA